MLSTTHYLLLQEIQIGLSFWYPLTREVADKIRTVVVVVAVLPSK